MISNQAWEVTEGEGTLVALAIHHGHAVRPEVAAYLKLTDDDRTREEDPHNGEWTSLAATRMVVLQSRFEFDLSPVESGSAQRFEGVNFSRA